MLTGVKKNSILHFETDRHGMKKATKTDLLDAAFTGIILLVILLMQPLQLYFLKEKIDVLFPEGTIAFEQRNLLLLIQGLMLLVIIPVYILTFIFSWKYRADNKKAKYDPDLVDHKLAEVVWWGLPLAMVIIIGWITWIKTEELDPYKPIASDKKPLKVQAVALQWKWLFIYPEQKMAAVNRLVIRKTLRSTSRSRPDAPMNSLWIPDLGGQIYAMPGMRTELFLIGNEVGESRGSSANISGKGFAGMHFMTKTSTTEEFDQWIQEAKQSTQVLNPDTYEKLAAPSEHHPVTLYRLDEEKLFHHILMKIYATAHKRVRDVWQINARSLPT